MSKFCCYSATLIVVIFLSASGLRINNFLQARLRILRSKVKTINWIAVLMTAQDTVDEFRRLRKAVKFDVSAGYGSISSPIVQTDPDLDLLDVEVITRKSPVLWAHQVGRKYVQKVPDKALLGGLVLIASELLKRGIKNEKLILSPRVREIANMTSAELDSKLEMLSSLEWKVDPFLKGEYDNLQSQPLEVIDRFIVTSILPNVEKELTPFMNSMVGDTDKVKVAVKNLKDAIKGSMVMLEKTANENIQTLAPPIIALSLQNQTTSTIDSASSNIIDKVDSVGQGVEEGMYCNMFLQIFMTWYFFFFYHSYSTGTSYYNHLLILLISDIYSFIYIVLSCGLLE